MSNQVINDQKVASLEKACTNLKNDLEERTGLKINRVEVGKINFLDDTAQIRIYYFADAQEFSDYSNNN